MTINNAETFVKSLWDWSCLDGCFGDTKIKPTDIDGFVERNNLFLIIETKLLGVQIPHGQMITFDRLIKTGYFTIFIVWGNPGKPEEMMIITRHGSGTKKANLETFRNDVKRWFAHADAVR